MGGHACHSHPVAGDSTVPCRHEGAPDRLKAPARFEAEATEHSHCVTRQEFKDIAWGQSPISGGHEHESCDQASCRFLPVLRHSGISRIPSFTTLSIFGDNVSAATLQRIADWRRHLPGNPCGAAFAQASRWQAQTQVWLL